MADELRYPWQRYVHPLQMFLPLDEDGLREPAPAGRFNPGAVPGPVPNGWSRLGDLRHLPVLAVLGERGVGKSVMLADERAHLAAEGASVRLLDAGSADPDIFRAELTDAVAWVRAHAERTSDFPANRPEKIAHVLIDGLDDLVLEPARSARVLARYASELASVSGVQVRLRMTCRTPLWPLYQEQLADFLGPVPTVAVAPLSREEVALAAQTRGVDPQALLAQLRLRGLMPWVRYPAMLNAILELAAGNAQIPGDVPGLFERMLLHLCEPGPGAVTDASLAPAQVVLDAATAIAGYTVLTGRFGIMLAETLLPPSPVITSAGALIGVVNRTVDGVELSMPLIRQVAESGIYTGRSDQVYMPSHGSYADYLAARFLHRASLPVERVLDLLLGPLLDGRRRVLLPLIDVAGHLASMNPQIRLALHERDPRALLRADLTAWSVADRKALVDALLASASSLDDNTLDLSVLGRVAHPGLAGQLRPILERHDDAPQVELALAVADACRLQELTATLVDLAADDGAPVEWRLKALAALARPIPEHHARRLQDVARTGTDADLTAGVIDALWPESIPATELTPLLPTSFTTPPSERQRLMLSWRLPVASRNDQLPGLLDWAVTATASTTGYIRESGVLILARAARLTTAPHSMSADPVADTAATDGSETALAKALANVAAHNGFFQQFEWNPVGEVLQHAPGLRHAVITELVAEQEPEKIPVYLRDWPGLFDRADAAWILTRLEEAPQETVAGWISVLLTVADLGDPEIFTAVYEVRDHMPLLAEQLPLTCSTRSEIARVAGERAHRHATLRAQAEQPEPPLEEHLAACLDQDFDAHPWQAWPLLQSALLTSAATTQPVGQPSWTQHGRALRLLDEPLATRVRDAAAQFLATVPADSVAILDNSQPQPNTVTLPYALTEAALHGIAAFLVLAEQEPDLLEQLSDDRWRLWSAPLLHLDTNFNEPALAAVRALVARAHRAGPHTFPDVVVDQVRRQHLRFAAPGAFTLLAGCWPQADLDAQLAERAVALDDEPELAEALLRGVLAQHDSPAARDAAQRLLAALPDDREPSPTTVSATVALLSPPLPWLTVPDAPVWRALLGNSQLYARVLQRATAPGWGDWPNALQVAPPATVADLYAKARDLYPPSDDPTPGPGVWATPRARLADVRDQMLRIFAEHADTVGFARLRAFAEEENRPDVFEPLLRTAYTGAIRYDWNPPHIDQLRQLLRDPDRRIIQDSASLRELILEALDELQANLQGSDALAHLLWNRTSAECTPKPEVSLSDLVAWSLKQRLAGKRIVINREVQIRRPRKSGLPDSVDIHIEAPAASPNGVRAVVLIEVKGGWNRDIETDMRNQLHDRYLAAEPEAVGIYLIGYYLCDAWTASTGRADHGSYPSFEAMRHQFTEAAGKLPRSITSVILDVTCQ